MQGEGGMGTWVGCIARTYVFCWPVYTWVVCISDLGIDLSLRPLDLILILYPDLLKSVSECTGLLFMAWKPLWGYRSDQESSREVPARMEESVNALLLHWMGRETGVGLLVHLWCSLDRGWEVWFVSLARSEISSCFRLAEFPDGLESLVCSGAKLTSGQET